MRMFYSLHEIAVLKCKLSACSLKKVQGKKKRDTADRQAVREEETHEPTAVDKSIAEEGTGGVDLLSSKDEDVIF